MAQYAGTRYRIHLAIRKRHRAGVAFDISLSTPCRRLPDIQIDHSPSRVSQFVRFKYGRAYDKTFTRAFSKYLQRIIRALVIPMQTGWSLHRPRLIWRKRLLLHPWPTNSVIDVLQSGCPGCPGCHIRALLLVARSWTFHISSTVNVLSRPTSNLLSRFGLG